MLSRGGASLESLERAARMLKVSEDVGDASNLRTMREISFGSGGIEVCASRFSSQGAELTF